MNKYKYLIILSYLLLTINGEQIETYNENAADLSSNIQNQHQHHHHPMTHVNNEVVETPESGSSNSIKTDTEISEENDILSEEIDIRTDDETSEEKKILNEETKEQDELPIQIVQNTKELDDPPLDLDIDLTAEQPESTILNKSTEKESSVELPYINHKKSFHSHIAPMVIYFDNLNQTGEEEIVLGRTSSLKGNPLNVELMESNGMFLQEIGSINAVDTGAPSTIPEAFLDPRKESCLYLYHDIYDIEKDMTKFNSGEECFLNRNQNDLKEIQTKTETRLPSSENDKILTFHGNSLSKLEVFNDMKSNIFDILFYIRTLQKETSVMSIIQKPNLFEIKLENGKLGVEIQCQDFKETFFMEIGGIQEGRWHMCYVLLDQMKGELLMQVNSRRETFFSANIKEGKKCQFFTENDDTEILIGSKYINSTNKMEAVENGLVACLTKVSLFHSSKYSSLTTLQTIQEMELTNVHQSDACYRGNIEMDFKNCSVKFGCASDIKQKTSICNNSQQISGPIATLHGNNYFSYRLYYWNERMHTFFNDFSFSFKSSKNNAILLYLSGENLDSTKDIQFISVTITGDDKLLFNLNLGGETVSVTLGDQLCDDKWHDVSVIHTNHQVSFKVDDNVEEKEISTESGNYFLNIDPVIFIGGIPGLKKDCALPPRNVNLEWSECRKGVQRWFYDVQIGACQNFTSSICRVDHNAFDDVESCLDNCHINGLSSYNFFRGCLKNVLLNGIKVLESTDEKNQLYLSGNDEVSSIHCDCRKEEIYLNFPMKESYLNLYQSSQSESFHFEMKIRANLEGSFASGFLSILNDTYQWEIKAIENEISLLIFNDTKLIGIPLEASVDNIHDISLLSDGNKIELSVDENSVFNYMENDIIFHSDILVSGFTGCVKEILVNNEPQDFLSFIGSSLASKDLNLRNCQVPNACETTSTCEQKMVSENRIQDYNSLGEENIKSKDLDYRKSCYEYRLLGYKESGQFIIDTDGSGPKPSAHVLCQFKENGDTFTVVDHNVPQKFSNEKVQTISFMIKVSYRDFTKELLRDLIGDSESCSQDVKFSCGPENISFKEVSFSSAWLDDVAHLDDSSFGVCRCAGSNENCYYQSKAANNQTKTLIDGIAIKNKTALPLLQLTFQRKNNNSDPYLEPNLSLGKLICKSKEEKKENIQFTSTESSFTLPAWTKGELRFRFRTTSSRSNLLYQPSVYVNAPNFKITIESENSLTFSHGIRNENKSVTFVTKLPFNRGEWNHVWIDESDQFLRIVFNDQIHYMEAPFPNSIEMMDGYLIFGNIPRKYKASTDEDLQSGFTGCIGTLVINGEEVNITEALTSPNSIDVKLGCKGSCDEHPCKNGAQCVEFWHSYKCRCANPFAHVGSNCEKDINENSITFMENDSEVVYNNSLQTDDEGINPFTSNFTFNIKTNKPNALLFVAKDYIQNILQIYLQESYNVVLLINFNEELHKIKMSTGNISLSKGQSVQIAVERLSNRTTLYVSTRGETFSYSIDKGVALINQDHYKQYPYEVLNHLVQYQHSFTVPGKYFLMFIGGAKSHGITSDLPGLIGCFRGLRINDIVIDFEIAQKWILGQGTSIGCKSVCERNKPCKNKGICEENFTENSEGDYSCNCEETSYVGEFCDEETAYTFDGREDGIALFNWTASYEDNFTISFAFSSEYSDENKHHLVYIKLNNTRILELEDISLFLQKEKIYMKWRRTTKDIVIESKIQKYNIPERHFVKVVYKNNEIILSVDSKIVPLSSTTNSSEYNVNESFIGLIIGGVSESGNTELIYNSTNFKGCISNLNIKTEELNFWPLEQYKKGEYFVRYGLPKLGKCSVFYKTKSRPTFYDFSKISAWESSEPDIVPVDIYSADDPINFNNVLSTPRPNLTNFQPDVSTAKIWPWALMGSVFFLMVLLLLLCALKGFCKSEKPTQDVEKSLAPRSAPKEEIPLLENEPSIHGSRRVPQHLPSTTNIPVSELPPYSLTPSHDVKQKLDNTKEELIPLQEADHVDVVNEDVVGSTKPIAIPLNVMDRDSNNKIPFKNQLSSDANTLRHIDSSSSEDSLVHTANPDGSADSIDSGLISKQEEKVQNVQEVNGAINDSVDNENIDNQHIDQNIFQPEEDQNIDQLIDMKRFYLIRKASEPPKLPPKRK